MSTVQEIQNAITQLPESERLSLLEWIHAQEEGELIADAELLKEAEEGARQLDSGQGVTLDEARKQTPEVDYTVILSPISIENLAEITAWVAQDNPARAETFGNELLDRIAILQHFPRAGSIYSANRKWRKLVLSPYVIIYRLKPRLRIVEVLTFRHCARNPTGK